MAKKSKINGVDIIDLKNSSIPELIGHLASFLSHSKIKLQLSRLENTAFDIDLMIEHISDISAAINAKFF